MARVNNHKRCWVERFTSHQCALIPNDWYNEAIGIIGYGGVNTIKNVPFISIDTPELLYGDSIYEVWCSNSTFINEQHGKINYRYDENLLFGCITVANESLQVATEIAYREIFALQDKLSFNSILRIWNYFPAINQETNGIERYLQFNIGRQNALLACGRHVTKNLPAASVLGTVSGQLNIAFIAACTQVINIENPRQVSAYHYPPRYGSPAFSRASVANLYGTYTLFISGTASIVGHETLHVGDVVKQTMESMNNINAVIAEAKRQVPAMANIELVDLLYKVYIRHSVDIFLVQNALQNYVGESVHAIYLQADICRADLLVEIEAYGDANIAFNNF